MVTVSQKLLALLGLQGLGLVRVRVHQSRETSVVWPTFPCFSTTLGLMRVRNSSTVVALVPTIATTTEETVRQRASILDSDLKLMQSNSHSEADYYIINFFRSNKVMLHRIMTGHISTPLLTVE